MCEPPRTPAKAVVPSQPQALDVLDPGEDDVAAAIDHAGEITRDEYFEWKLNWPHTCDDGLESEYYIPWRKNK